MERLGRDLLKVVEEAFKNPAIQAEYEEWLKEYRKRPEVIADELARATEADDDRR